MIPCSLDRTINITYIEASLEEVWHAIATPEGMNTYLTYKAEKTGDPHEIHAGDQYHLCYGDIINRPTVTESVHLHRFSVKDCYESIAPDGQTEYFNVQTTFHLEQDGTFVKITLTVTGFGDDIHGQWFRECLEMGWRRSLMNLKSVLELGMDLRAEMFSYPRLGVVNCSLRKELSIETGVEEDTGNYLMEVFPNGPAQLAGLKPGDVITHLDDAATRNYSEFVRVISSYFGKNGDVKLRYIRDGQTYETNVKLSLEETFTGLVDVETESLDEIRHKREKLAMQRSASGSLWKHDE